MPPLMLDIVVDDQGQIVPQPVAQTVGQDMPVGVSTLSPDESIPMAVQSLNTLAAQAAAEFQRLRAPVAALIKQATATNVHAALLTENARFQRFQKELSIAPLWEEESKRLQKMAASLQVMNERVQKVFRVEEPWKEEQERLQRMVSSFRAMEREAQALINPAPPPWLAAMRTAATHAKEENERLHRMLFSTAEETARLQQTLGLSLRSTAPMIPEWLQERQRFQATVERRICTDARDSFAYNPKHVEWFVTQALGLSFSPSSFFAVWAALHDGGWMTADKPLQYVRRVATHIHARDAEQNGSLFNSMLPTPNDPSPEQASRHDEEQRFKQQGLSAGRSSDALVILPTSLTPQESDTHTRLALSPAVPPQRKRGRPPGSGIYTNADELLQAICPIIQQLRHERKYPSQARVTELLPIKTTDRQLQRWVSQYLKMSWKEMLTRW